MRLLAELASQDGRVLAGGQSLVPIMNFRLARPAYLIDINAVAGLEFHNQRADCFGIAVMPEKSSTPRSRGSITGASGILVRASPSFRSEATEALA